MESYNAGMYIVTVLNTDVPLSFGYASVLFDISLSLLETGAVYIFTSSLTD